MISNFFDYPRKEIQLLPNDVIYLPVDSVPLVVLLGQKGCGRTSFLVSLAHYLEEQDYHIEPDRNFRAGDNCYADWCDNFKKICRSLQDVSLYKDVHYALVQISDNHFQPVCRIMELPGEYLFDPRMSEYLDFYSDYHTPIRNVLKGLFTLPCPILWMFMFEFKILKINSDKPLKLYLSWLFDHIHPDKRMLVYTKISQRLPTWNDASVEEILLHYRPVNSAALPFSGRSWEIQVIWNAIIHSFPPKTTHVQQLGMAIEELKIQPFDS